MTTGTSDRPDRTGPEPHQNGREEGSDRRRRGESRAGRRRAAAREARGGGGAEGFWGFKEEEEEEEGGEMREVRRDCSGSFRSSTMESSGCFFFAPNAQKRSPFETLETAPLSGRIGAGPRKPAPTRGIPARLPPGRAFFFRASGLSSGLREPSFPHPPKSP